jgi:hypothetical protein
MNYEERIWLRLKSLYNQLGEQEEVNVRQQIQIYGLWEEVDAGYLRVATLCQQLRATESKLQVLRYAHNRHVLAGAPELQAPGWARRTAQAKSTWAKPKGWRV